MKKISIILMLLAFALTACAGIQIKPPDIDQVISTGPKLVGALIAENNPDHVDTILKYGDMLLAQSEPIDFKAKLDEGVDWLLRKYIDKAAIRVLIIDCLPEIEFEAGAIPTPAWMNKVKPIVKSFIEGVRIGAPVTSSIPDVRMRPTGDFEVRLLETDVIPSGEIIDDKSFIQRYCDIYETEYLKFMWGRTLD